MAPRDVVPGQDYDIQLDQAIQDSLAFISLISSESNTSRYVKSEVELAFSCRKPIFPVRIADVQPARGLQLYLRTAHWADAFGAQEERGFESLARSLRRLSNPAQVAESKSPAGAGSRLADAPRDTSHQETPETFRRRLVIASVAGFALVVLVIGLFAAQDGDSGEPPSPGPEGDTTIGAVSATPGAETAGDVRGEAMIGANLADIDSQIAEAAGVVSGKGVAVDHVAPGYPADKAGARVGDVIHAIGGISVSSTAEAIARFRASPVGRPVRVDIRRAGAPLSLNFVPVPRISDEEQARLDPGPPAAVTTVVAPSGALEAEKYDVARWIKLPFYANTQLWELGIRGVSATRVYLIPQAGPAVFLNGTSNPVHEFNLIGGLDLSTADKAASYLRFFCAVIWGEQGAFRIVEFGSDLPSGASQQVRDAVHPLSVQPHARGWITRATFLYGDQVAEADFVIERTGLVEMLQDEFVDSSPELKSTLYVNEQRQRASLIGVSVENWPNLRLIPGTWSNASGDEVYRTRMLILASRR